MKKSWIFAVDGRIESRHRTKEEAIETEKIFKRCLKECGEIGSLHLLTRNIKTKVYAI